MHSPRAGNETLTAVETGPIFIVGTARSGTTLTGQLLGNLPALFIPGETHFLADIYQNRKRIGDLAHAASRQRIVERLATIYRRLGMLADQRRVDKLIADGSLAVALSPCRTYRDAFAAFMGLQASVAGKARWGNHTPKDVFAVDTILTMFPDARIIGCIRDPRDFLASYRDYWRTAGGPDAARIRALYHPVIMSLLWKASAKVLLKACERHKENVLISRYEDLVSSPAEHVQRLCKHVGEEFDATAVQTDHNNSSANTGAQGIYGVSIARWHKALPAEEALIAQWLCATEMKRFGYHAARVDISPARLLGILFSTPLGFLKALKQNAGSEYLSLSYMTARLRSLASGGRSH